MKVESKKWYSADWKAYELIDAGNNLKLERWGEIITIRPEYQAYFKSGKSITEWRKIAHFEFHSTGSQKGEWKQLNPAPTSWDISYKNLTFCMELTRFKHVGLFPEQALNWKAIHTFLKPGMQMLNLFAYTGAASIVARATGADVTHVDSVKQLITWAKKNMEISHLTDIRWICDDALKFAQKEVKREHQYHLIVMDPPAWGIGAKNEKWKIENELEGLMKIASNLLHPNGMLIVNTYSPRMDLSTIRKLALPHFSSINTVELWKKTTTGKDLFYGNLLHGIR